MKKTWLSLEYSNILKLAFGAILTLCLFGSGCMKDQIFDGETVDLSFSVDTLRFDTVFTTQGSATRFLKIYNRENEDVIIDRISMVKEDQSFFRLNVDGTPEITKDSLEIPANDSIYVFVEVTIDPDAPLSVSPFIIEEYLQIQYKDQTETVLFEAWGQNANYLTSRDDKGQINFLSCDLGQFPLDDPKPYIIHGILIVDSCEVVIPEGTNIYVHGGIAINQLGIYNDGLITFLQHGSLIANGTAENPITIQGDRLESNFTDDQGQWVGLRFFNESKNNQLHYTTIKNSLIGIRLDSSAQLLMENAQILNTSTSGITAVHADVEMTNCLFYNNGTNAAQFVYGGNYDINHCTFYNSGNQDPAFAATNFICRNEACDLTEVFPLNLNLRNSIVSGTNEDELLFVDNTEGSSSQDWQISLSNNILKVDEILESDLYGPLVNSCMNCTLILNNDSLFVDRENFDLHLDTLSIATNKGIGNLPIDLEGNQRDIMPDIGCYEYIQ